MLIQAEALSDLMQNSPTELRIFDTRFAMPGPDFDPLYGRQAYLGGHIPGAIYVDLENDLASPPTATSGRHPLPQPDVFLDKMQSWGIEPQKTLVIYDDKHGFMAARLWWMLHRWADHRDVLLLNGGFDAWQTAGLPHQTEEVRPVGTPYRYQLDDTAWVNTSHVRKQVNAPNIDYALIDARAHTRYSGAQENVDPVAGHIPTAYNLPCTENTSGDGKFLPKSQLQNRFSAVIGRAKSAEHVVHSCGSGVTACHNIFAMTLAGYPGAKLYAGSWSEWIRDPDNPIAIGD